MTTLETHNGQARQRRRLDNSIAKMDQLIEGLAEAIPGTIKDVLEDSVSNAISAGIKAAVLEVLSNPEMFSMLRGAMPPTAPVAAPVPPVAVSASRPSRLRAWLAASRAAIISAYHWLGAKMVATATEVCGAAGNVVYRVTRLRRRLRTAIQIFNALLLPFTVGCLAVAIALVAPNWAVIAMSGLGGTCLTFVVQVGWWVRRKFGSLALMND